jgi:hypothetical protein
MNKITEQDVLNRLKTESPDIKSSDSLQTSRKSICNGCSKKQNILGVEYCGECSCILLFKTAFKYARCPLNKWDVGLPPFVNDSQK